VAVYGAEPPLCPEFPKASHRAKISFSKGRIAASGIVAARITMNLFGKMHDVAGFLNILMANAHTAMR